MTLMDQIARATQFVVGEARVREMLMEWWRWCELENETLQNVCEPYSLATLAAPTCEIAEAIDEHFAGNMSDKLLDEDLPLLEEIYARRGPDALARWRKYVSARPAFTDAEFDALGACIKAQYRDGFGWKDVGSHVQIVQDLDFIYAGGDAVAFARDYVRKLPPGWSESVVVSLRLGEHPVVCRWTTNRVPTSVTEVWAKAFGQRFVVLRSYVFGTDERVVFPATNASAGAATLEQLASPPPVAAAVQVLPTGLEPLDAVLATGGVPTGGRVTAYGETANAKTTALLEMAEALASRGLRVVWIATGDEPRESIQARRRQRRGMSRVEALTSTNEHDLDGIHVVDGRKVTLDDVLAAPGRIDALFLDPLTKVPTRGGSSDQVVHVGEVLDLVEASGVTTFMTAPVVRGAGRRAKTERALGGARIEAGATLLLELTRKGDDVAIHVVKSRLGGEGLEVAMRLDRERQRVLPALAAPGAAPTGAVSVEERIWADVQRLLAVGPQSARELTEAVTGKATTVRAVVRAKLGAGALLKADGKVRLR